MTRIIKTVLFVLIILTLATAVFSGGRIYQAKSDLAEQQRAMNNWNNLANDAIGNLATCKAEVRRGK